MRTHLEWFMGVPLSRPAALAARLEAPIEEWPYLDGEVLLKTRSRKVCMTCHWFRHHAGVNCIPVLTCQLQPGPDRAWRPPHQPLPRLDRRPGPPEGLGAGSGLSGPCTSVTGSDAALSPQEGWLSDGRQVLHFRPRRYDRWSQSLEVTFGEVMAGGEPPLL